MEVYVVRHTTPAIAKGICYGQSDIDVTDTFDTEVATIHQQIAAQGHTQLYSSPLQRCQKLAATWQLPIHTDPRLQEVNFGDWELTAWDAIPQEQLTPWMSDFVHTAPPKGESYIALQQRIVDFYHSLSLATADTIIIVTHAGPMRALLAHLRGIELKDSFDIKISYGAVIKI